MRFSRLSMLLFAKLKTFLSIFVFVPSSTRRSRHESPTTLYIFSPSGKGSAPLADLSYFSLIFVRPTARVRRNSRRVFLNERILSFNYPDTNCSTKSCTRAVCETTGKHFLETGCEIRRETSRPCFDGSNSSSPARIHWPREQARQVFHTSGPIELQLGVCKIYRKWRAVSSTD